MMLRARLEAWQRIFTKLCDTRPLLLNFAAGALTALSFAPLGFWPILFVSLPVCFLLLNAAVTRRSCILRAFLFGYGYFMAGTYWIAGALLVDAEQFGWLVPFCVLGLSAVMAFWFIVLGALFWWVRTASTAQNIVRFALLWVVVELARSYGMFGFPWNLLGYVALESGRISQLASVTSVYGLSFYLVLMALVPALFIARDVSKKIQGRAVIAALLATILLYGLGMWRMRAPVDYTETRIRIVQASIPQSLKWTDEGRVDSLKKHIDYTRLTTERAPDIIIWPETALPFTLYPDSPWPERLAEILPKHTLLITGAVRGDDTTRPVQLWNSIAAIDANGTVRATYDKHQLVPFGEFVPFRAILPMNKITPGAIDFSRGNGAQTLALESLPSFSPLVCYEAIFPQLVVHHDQRPDWMLNVTNDAWYGDTAGPPQHFAMARMRSIEQGLPLVRAANNGISAVVDPYGRIVRALPLNAKGIIEQRLPKPLSPTIYARYGNGIMVLILLCAGGIAFALHRRSTIS
jgi:apolipoprotein N-acyltransferase